MSFTNLQTKALTICFGVTALLASFAPSPSHAAVPRPRELPTPEPTATPTPMPVRVVIPAGTMISGKLQSVLDSDTTKHHSGFKIVVTQPFPSGDIRYSGATVEGHIQYGMMNNPISPMEVFFDYISFQSTGQHTQIAAIEVSSTKKTYPPMNKFAPSRPHVVYPLNADITIRTVTISMFPQFPQH